MAERLGVAPPALLHPGLLLRAHGEELPSAFASSLPFRAADLAAADEEAALVLDDLAEGGHLLAGDGRGEEAHVHLAGDVVAAGRVDRDPRHDLVEQGAEDAAVRRAREAVRPGGRVNRVWTRPPSAKRSSWKPRGFAFPQAMQPG